MIVNAIHTLAQWIDVHVCDGLNYKKPTPQATNGLYSYELVKPAVFEMYVPTLNTQTTTAPSVCVQLLNGTTEKDLTKYKIRLNFSVWNTGEHCQDVYTHNGTNYERPLVGEEFSVNENGWVDVWNFTDKAIAELKKAQYIHDLRIIHDSIQFGVFTEDDTVVNLYPYYFSYVELEVEQIKNTSNYQIAGML